MDLARPRPTKTLLAVLIVGALASAAPLVVANDVADDDPTAGLEHRAVVFDPVTEANLLAEHTNQVTNLTAIALDDDDRPYVESALENESVVVPSSVDTSLPHDDGYAVRRGTYYYVDVSETDGGRRISLAERSPYAVMDDLAVAYDDASSDVKRVVERGNASVDGEAPPVVERDGTYYAVGPTLDGVLSSMAAVFLALVVGAVARIGHVYVGVTLGVLGVTAVAGRRRSLTARSAAVVASVAVLIHVSLVAVGSASFPGVGFGALASIPSTLALAGVVAVGAVAPEGTPTRDRWLAVALPGAAVAAGAVASAAVVGPAALVTAPLGTLATLAVFGLPLLVLGYVHGEAGGTSDDGGGERPRSGTTRRSRRDAARADGRRRSGGRSPGDRDHRTPRGSGGRRRGRSGRGRRRR